MEVKGTNLYLNLRDRHALDWKYGETLGLEDLPALKEVVEDKIIRWQTLSLGLSNSSKGHEKARRAVGFVMDSLLSLQSDFIEAEAA